MRTILLSSLLLAASFACEAGKDKPAMTTSSNQPLALDFTMKQDGGKLRVD